jgi:hypothetical protein
LDDLESDDLIEILITNPLKLHFGQELGNIHTPYPNIEGDMEFTKVLIVKQKLEENKSGS